MAKRQIKQGATNQTVDVFVQDSSKTDGSGLTGLLFNSSGLVCYFREGPTATAAQLTLATQTVTGAHTDGGFKEISSANMPGWYRLDLSDTMVSGTNSYVGVVLKGATNMAQVNLEIELTKTDHQDGVRFGLTALPNAAADAAGGLPISDAGALDLDSKLANTNEVTAARMAALTDWINGGRLDLILDIIAADVVNIDGAAMRGTDSAALASAYTSARAAFLDNINGHTAQTGDSFARIGAAGASLTDLGGMSTAMKAEVQVEANDALVANNLDHLLKVAVLGTDVIDNSVFAKLVSKNATADWDNFVNTTDSLQAQRDIFDTRIPDILSLANINTEVDTALSDINLDHLLKVAAVDADVINNSIIALLAAGGTPANFTTYNNTTDSQEAIRNRGDSDWKTGASSELTLADVQQIRHRLNLDGTQAIPTAGGAAKMAGTDADLTLKSVKIDNSSGTHAMELIAGSTGIGLRVAGGANASAMELIGGTTSGIGLKIQGQGTGDGMEIAGGTNGNGLELRGGVTQGNGLKIDARGNNDAGMNILGDGSGAGLKIVGGSTGHGIHAFGTGTGTGIFAQSGIGATGDGARFEAKSTNGSGLKLIKTGTGVDLDAPDHGAGSWITATGFSTLIKSDIPKSFKDTDVANTNPVVGSLFENVVGPSTVDELQERTGITSAVISKTINSKTQKYIVLYTQDGAATGTRNFQKELLGALIGGHDDTAAGERQYLPILGFYQQDGAGAITEINGIAADLGVTASLDLAGASWTGATDESTAGAGYSMILPFVDGYDVPDSNNDLRITYPRALGHAELSSTSMTDWTDAELKQIRDALGIDGAKVTSTGGKIQALITTVGVAGLGLSDLGGMSTIMKAEVNAEMVDVLTVDTIADLGVGKPPATPTFAQAMMYRYSALRNKIVQTDSIQEFYNDADTKIWKKAVTPITGQVTFEEGVTS